MAVRISSPPFIPRTGDRSRTIPTTLDGGPARVRLEALAVLRLHRRHYAEPRRLAALPDGIDRAAAMGREAGAEDDAGIAEVGIGDDAFAHARDRFVERGHDHAISERLEVRGGRV